MKCYKCEKEIGQDSKFCSNCGTEAKEKPNDIRIEELTKLCSKAWFIIGYARGCSKNNSDSLTEFEKDIKINHTDLWEWYKEVLDYFQNWLKEKNNEKNKETNGSK